MRLSLRVPSGLKTLNMQSLSMARKAKPPASTLEIRVYRNVTIEDDDHISEIEKDMVLFIMPSKTRGYWLVFVPDNFHYFKYEVDFSEVLRILQSSRIKAAGKTAKIEDFSHLPMSMYDSVAAAFEARDDLLQNSNVPARVKKQTLPTKKRELSPAQLVQKEIRDRRKAARNVKDDREARHRDLIRKGRDMAQHINQKRTGQDRYQGTPLDRNPKGRNTLPRIAIDRSGNSMLPESNLVLVKRSNGAPGKVVHYNDVNGIYITSAVDLIGSLVRPLRWSNGDWGTTKITKYITRKAGKTVFSRASKDKRLLINLNRIRVDSQFMGFKLVDVSDTGYRLVHPKARISVRVYLEKEVVKGSRLKIEVLGADSEVAKVSTVDLNQ